MAFEIVPFEAGMLGQAGELFALRHQRQRTVRPELPPHFEQLENAIRAVEAAWKREWSSGFAAIHDGKMLGYTIGDMQLNELWGRSGWIRYAGCAVAPDHDMELVRDLYAALGEYWVETFGCYNHFALMPPSEESLISKWFALAFGIEHIHGLLALNTLDLSLCPHPPGVEIRRVTPEDRIILEEMSDVIWRQQVKAPCWGIHLPEVQAQKRHEWGDMCIEPENSHIYLAFCDGKPAGVQGFIPIESGAESPFVPEHCIELGVAGTQEWARKRGIGQALLRHGLANAVAEGFQYCLTDWRSTNLLSSRYWPRQGFQPVAYRLARRVDFRIAWAGKRA